MKPLIVLIGLMVVGCATTPTMKGVAGTYERKVATTTYKLVLLDNGATEYYTNGGKNEPHKWSLVDKEIHLGRGREYTSIYRINQDGEITRIAKIDKDGKRTGIPKDEQYTFKKIK